MMLVKTRLGQSSIHGIGLFADQDIRKGTPVWEFTPGFDQKIPTDKIGGIPDAAKEDFLTYSYTSVKNGKYYILCCDNARFFNHSDEPNVVDVPSNSDEEDIDIAGRDIERGEELTCDYRTFEAAKRVFM
ncbi:MAG: SET domain-containing protein [Candidatus Zixiibacteriota bacterium]